MEAMNELAGPARDAAGVFVPAVLGVMEGCFRRYDVDGDGRLSFSEFKALHTCKSFLSEARRPGTRS